MMVTTSFLSMWLSNTASTAMMLPIANAILKSLFGHREARKDLDRDDKNTGEAGGLPGRHHCCRVGGDEQGPQAIGEGPGYRHMLGTLLCLNGDSSLRIR